MVGKQAMAKVFEIKCPHCGRVQKMRFSDILGFIANTNGMRGRENSNSPLSQSLNEENWIDLKNPCPACRLTFSYNIATGESRV